MTDQHAPAVGHDVVTLWLDPVCPFSWNTARWLRAAAAKSGFTLELRPMSLAVLNEGRELPPPQQARMNDSRTVGRLMAALRDELGAEVFSQAYFTFGQLYFDQSSSVDDDLATSVLRSVSASRTTAAAMTDSSWDPAVRLAHEASQSALGDIGGSPLVTIDWRTVFGPVLSAVPEPDRTVPVFDALVALVETPQFHQLQRPRSH